MHNDHIYRMSLTHFAAGGVDAASLESIAADAKVPIAEVVAAHPTKDALFQVAVARALGALTVELSVIADGDRPASERLLLMVRRLAKPTTTEGTALFVVLREMLDGNQRAETAFSVALAEAFEGFVRVIGEAQLRAEIKPLPPRFVMSVLLSGIVLPQLIGFGSAEGKLQGVHAREEGAREDDLKTPPQSALLAASIEAIFNGIATSPVAMGGG